MSYPRMRPVALTALLLSLIGITACEPGEAPLTRSIVGEPYGVTPEGDTVHSFTLTNPNGLQLQATTYGGIITSLRTPDRSGATADIVLGYDDLQGYLDGSPYFGAIVGRYGNRIAGARFQIGEELFTLAANDGDNHLHGGVRGFDKVVWSGEPFSLEDRVGVELRYVSPDGEEGYPGTLQVKVTYALTDADELVVDYLATTDRPTPVNLTQHSYFNLAGHGDGDILGHQLMIAADHFTPVGATLIPTGEISLVEGTPFDFRAPHEIGERIAAHDAQIAFGGGYDHNFVLNRTTAGAEVRSETEGESGAGPLFLAAEVFEPTSGRTLQILTTEPGIQFYSGNFLDGSITGKDGVVYQHRSGFCLETQHYPDSPNQEGFPSTILRPGTEYRSRTVFRFGVRDG
ncbi:MAG: aldose epimerase family protein [Gemmatimonadota bacterium]